MNEQLDRIEAKLDMLIQRRTRHSLARPDMSDDAIVRFCAMAPASGTVLYRKYRAMDIRGALERLVKSGRLVTYTDVHPGPGRKRIIYSVTHSPAASVGSDCGTANNA